jgi:hydroxymethylpyrimidine/phosphomethylpyrimidine kinase
MAAQGSALCGLGATAVLMKGGHLEGPDSPDCLVSNDTVIWFDAPRTLTANTHGTGCTLSSALAAHLAKGHSVADATAAAKSYVAHAIAYAGDLSVGTGHGPTHHFASLYSE